MATRDSDMSFAVSCRRSGLEYSSRGANGFFAQRRNLVRPSHLSLLREIVRFNREAPALLGAPDAERQTLGDFLESRRFGEAFTHRYLFPMASAIWSASLDAIRSFPALTLIRFFDNHGLLSLNAQPTWKVVAGGSHTYIPRLTAPLSGDIHQGAAIQARAAKRGRGHADLPRSAVDAVRRGGVRVPRRSGVAAPRRSERSRARRVLQFHHHDQRRLAAHGRVGAAGAGAGARVLELPARRRRRCAADGDLRPESPPGTDDAGAVLRDPQPRRPDRRTPRAAPVRLSPPALHARGDPRAAAVARGERRQPHALLRRLLVATGFTRTG